MCEGPSGGGATYILPGLIEASESSYAVLGITTDISVGSYGKYPLTEVDQEAMMRPLTKWNTVIRRADHIPRMVRAAFRAMTTGRSGAAHLGLPYDIQYDAVDSDDIWADPQLQSYPAYRTGPQLDAVEAAIDAILSAKNPLIVCGGGVVISGAEEELNKLASRLDIPVATSISGQGVVGRHPSQLSWRCGFQWRHRRDLGDDGGSRPSDFHGLSGRFDHHVALEAPKPGARIVHFDSDPMVIGANYPTEVGVAGDLLLSLTATNEALNKRSDPAGRFGGAEAIADIKRRKFESFHALANSNRRTDSARAGHRYDDESSARGCHRVVGPGDELPLLFRLLQAAQGWPLFHHQPGPWRPRLFAVGRAGRLVRQTFKQDCGDDGRRVLRLHLR